LNRNRKQTFEAAENIVRHAAAAANERESAQENLFGGPDAASGTIAIPLGETPDWPDMERLRPAAKGQLEVVEYKSWYRDPFSAGDWAVWKPGQVTAFAQDIAKSHGRIHFCGEHTAVANRGMEGAMESGERVALEVLQAV